MLHLSAERLASLADKTPTPIEALHIAECRACARGLSELRHIVSEARSLRDLPTLPLTDWSTLSHRLGVATNGEGAPQGATGSAVLRARRMRRAASLAASFALVVGGAAAGRISVGASPLPGVGSAAVADEADSSFTSTAEALNVFLKSQRQFQRAAAYLAANDERASGTPSVYLPARLAALEEMNASLAAALREAPTDPVLNNFYLSTLSERDASARQLSQVMQVGRRVKGY